jgi:hypothetical protein
MLAGSVDFRATFWLMNDWRGNELPQLLFSANALRLIRGVKRYLPWFPRSWLVSQAGQD